MSGCYKILFNPHILIRSKLFFIFIMACLCVFSQIKLQYHHVFDGNKHHLDVLSCLRYIHIIYSDMLFNINYPFSMQTPQPHRIKVVSVIWDWQKRPIMSQLEQCMCMFDKWLKRQCYFKLRRSSQGFNIMLKEPIAYIAVTQKSLVAIGVKPNQLQKVQHLIRRRILSRSELQIQNRKITSRSIDKQYDQVINFKTKLNQMFKPQLIHQNFNTVRRLVIREYSEAYSVEIGLHKKTEEYINQKVFSIKVRNKQKPRSKFIITVSIHYNLTCTVTGPIEFQFGKTLIDICVSLVVDYIPNWNKHDLQSYT